METSDIVECVLAWIEQAESQAFRIEGSHANGGHAQLEEVKNDLLNALTEEQQIEILEHYIGKGVLPLDLWDAWTTGLT